MDIHRLQGGAHGPARSQTAVTGARLGSLHGFTVAVVDRSSEPDHAAAASQAHDADRAAAKRLSQRQVRREMVQKALTEKQVAQNRRYAETTGTGISARRIAMRIVRDGELPAMQNSRQGVMENYLGLTAAHDYLSQLVDVDEIKDIDEHFYKASIFPVKGLPVTAKELSKALIAAGDDAEKLADLLSEVDGLERDPQKLLKALNTIRYDERELIAYLSEAQGLDKPAGPKRFPGSAADLSERLMNAGEDAGEVAAILEGTGLQGSPQALLNMIRPFRNNPQKLAAFIRERQSPASRPDEDRKQLQQEIRDALRDLELTHGGLIRSNLDAESSAAKSADANKFLDGYTEVLYASTGFADASKKLLARFGLNELPATVGLMKEALESMKKALDSTKVELGDDLRQPIPDSVHLVATLSALSHMHVLTTLIETTEKFVKSMEGVAKAAGIASAPLDASVLLNGLVEIVDTAWIAPGQFERLLKDLGVKEEPATIVTLQGVARMLRELPDKVYRDNNARTAILTAAQDALDTAIDREEALDEARPSEPAP